MGAFTATNVRLEVVVSVISIATLFNSAKIGQ